MPPLERLFATCITNRAFGDLQVIYGPICTDGFINNLEVENFWIFWSKLEQKTIAKTNENQWFFQGAFFDVVENLTFSFFEKIFFRFRIAPPHPPPRRKMHICRPGRLVLDPCYGRSTLGGGVGDLDWRGLHPAGARCRPGRSSHIAIWHQMGPFGSKRCYCFTKANSKNQWISIWILLYFWKNHGCEVFYGQYCTEVSIKNFNKGSEFIWERPRWPSEPDGSRWPSDRNWRIVRIGEFYNSDNSPIPDLT